MIDGNYLGTDRDFEAVVHAIEAAREIGTQHAFDGLCESELIPGPKASAEEIRELARLASASFGHAVGTPTAAQSVGWQTALPGYHGRGSELLPK